jgi:hypothetical protein
MRRNKVSGSSFRDWAAECTGFPFEVAEMGAGTCCRRKAAWRSVPEASAPGRSLSAVLSTRFETVRPSDLIPQIRRTSAADD